MKTKELIIEELNQLECINHDFNKESYLKRFVGISCDECGKGKLKVDKYSLICDSCGAEFNN